MLSDHSTTDRPVATDGGGLSNKYTWSSSLLNTRLLTEASSLLVVYEINIEKTRCSTITFPRVMVNVCLPGTYPTTSPDLIWRSNQFGVSKNTNNIIIISQYLSVFTFLHILFVLLLNKTLHLLYVNRNSINTKEQTRTLKHDHPPKGTTQLSSPVYLSLIFFLPIAALEIACSADRHFLPLSSFNFYWNWWAHFFSTSTRLLRSHHHHLHYYHL